MATLLGIGIVGGVNAYPPEGWDCFPSSGTFDFEIFGVGRDTVTASGAVTVGRGNPFDPGDGRDELKTRISYLYMAGFSNLLGDSVFVTERWRIPSIGKVKQQTAAIDFPAESFFDVYPELFTPALGGVFLFTKAPLHLENNNLNALPDTTPYIGQGPLFLFNAANPNETLGVLWWGTHTPGVPIPCGTNYPPEELDWFQSFGNILVEIFGIGIDFVNLSGPTVVMRGGPHFRGGGQIEIQTEMVEMDLVGTSPLFGNVRVQESPYMISPGGFWQINPGIDFPAQGVFDVFVEVQSDSAPGLTLINLDPFFVRADSIDTIPPFGTNYFGNFPVFLVDQSIPTDTIGQILEVFHTPASPIPCPIDTHPAGVDSFCADGWFDIEIIGLGRDMVFGTGETKISREQEIDYGDGLLVIETEITQLCLTGFSPLLGDSITVCHDQSRPSLGEIVQGFRGTNFPRASYFDVFVEVGMNDTVIAYAQDPLHVAALIDSIPPLGQEYIGSGPINLYDPRDSTTVIAILHSASHAPGVLPPCPCTCPFTAIHDGAMDTLALASMPDTVFTDSTLTPTARVWNLGNVRDSIRFDVQIIPNNYWDTLWVTLDSNQDSLLTFANWVVPSNETTYTMTICAFVPGDIDTTNDCAQKTLFALTDSIVGVEESLPISLPTRFALHQNNPNPFSELTAISYQLKAPSHTALNVYDLSGRLVRTLVDGEKDAGIYTVNWNRKDNFGREVSSGIYFYRLKARFGHAGDFTSTKKLILLR
jgi:hypothetical protein